MIAVLTFIGKLLVALLAFGLIVCLHEFGHFIAARIFGVQVNEFAVGMGPKVLSFRANIPKKMRKELQEKGEFEAFMQEREAYLKAEKKKKRSDSEEDEDDAKKTPFYGTVWSLRLLPLGGFCAMEGEEEESDNQNAFNKKAVWKRMIIAVAGCTMNLLLGFVLLTGLALGEDLVGTNMVAAFTEDAVSNSQGGLQEKDEILEVNGTKVLVSNDIFYNMLRDMDGKVDFLVNRDGKEVFLENVPFHTEESDGIHYIKIDFSIYGVKNNLLLSIREAALNTFCFVRQVIYTLFDLIVGNVPMTALSGPVGVIDAVTQTISLDLRPFFNLMALLTVNIGVMNLFPIAPLDGSLFVFLLIEAIIRRPVPEKLRTVVQIIGIVMILALFVFVTYSDIARLITG